MEINLAYKRLDASFIFCLISTSLTATVLPLLRLQFFVPFLIISFYKKKLIGCLWLSVACGLIMDLLSSQPRLGIYALNYSLTTLILYGQRRNFFADSLTTLPMMTFFFSLLSTVILLFLGYIMEMSMMFSWAWVLTDLLVMPAADALLAFIFFILPPLLIGKRPKQGKDYFLQS